MTIQDRKFNTQIPEFRLDVSDPKIRLRDIKVNVVPKGWLSKMVWRFIRCNIICVWYEEVIK